MVYNKRKSKRSFKRKRNFRRKFRKSNFSKAPMPNRFATKLRYVGSAQLNPAVGLPAVHVVNAIGCFDPDVTAAGHQPRGFDQLMTMYDHYTVIGSKITVDFCNTANSAGEASTIGIAVKDTATAYTDANNYLEGRNIISTVLPSANTGGPAPMRTLHKAMSTRKFLGVSKPLSSDTIRGDVTANPTDSSYFHIFIQALANVAADLPSYAIQFRVEYLVVFTEPVQPAQS